MPTKNNSKNRKRGSIRTAKIVKCEWIRQPELPVFPTEEKAVDFIESFAHTIPRRVKRIEK
jgi:hypothetical protein